MNSYQNIHFFSKTTWVPFRRLLSSRFFSSKIHYLFNIVLIFPILLVTLFWKISPKSFTNMLSNSSNIKSKTGASAWKKKTNMTEKCLQWRKKRNLHCTNESVYTLQNYETPGYSRFSRSNGTPAIILLPNVGLDGLPCQQILHLQSF